MEYSSTWYLKRYNIRMGYLNVIGYFYYLVKTAYYYFFSFEYPCARQTKIQLNNRLESGRTKNTLFGSVRLRRREMKKKKKTIIRNYARAHR